MNVRSLLNWATALATLLLIGALCWQCVDVYLDGNAPQNLDSNGVHISAVYEIQDVTMRLKRFIVPEILYVLLIAAATIANRPQVEKAPIEPISPENRLRLLKKRCQELPAAAQAEERFRRMIWFVFDLIMITCGVFSGAYLANQNHFTSWDLEAVVGDMLLHIIPWMIVALAAAYLALLLHAKSCDKECAILKSSSSSKAPAKPVQKGSRNRLLRPALYFVAIVFIVLGVMNGGLKDVLVKAINICTECIGLG